MLVATLATPAAAQVASRKADVDRDGVPDEITLDAAGGLTVTSGKTRAVLGRKAVTAAKVTRGDIQVTSKRVGKRPVIAAIADREAVALEWSGGGLREVWRGPVGPEPPDGESTVHIEAGENGLVRYRGRAGVARCDEKPAYLFAEGYNFANRRFARADRIPVRAERAQRLVPSQAPPAGAQPNVMSLDFKVLAASSQSSARTAGDLVPPVEIDDARLDTAWVEGAPRAGEGEFVTARASITGGKVIAVRVVPGHAGSPKMLTAHNRVREVVLLVGRDQSFVAELQDVKKTKGPPAQWIVLPHPIATDCVSLVIKSVYPASPDGRGHTAISELAVLTEMDLSGGGLDVLAQRVAAGEREGEEAARTLEKIGARAEAALVAEAQKSGVSAATLLRLRRVLASLPAGAGELARGLAAEGVHPSDAARFERALVAIGAPSVAVLAQVIANRGAGEDGRARAAHALGRIGDASAMPALLAAAGTGPRAVRRAISLALGDRPVSELPALVAAAIAAAQEPAGREADLWRAVGILAHDAPASPARTDAAAEIASRLMQEGVGYELRHRLIEAAAGLSDDALLALVALETSTSTSTLTEAQRTALRRVAAGALAKVDTADASRALTAATRDADPGVREIAAVGLATSSATDADAPLAARLSSDRWARVRRAAATGLGGRCRRATPADALRRAALTDATDDVRTAALDALAACRAAGAGRFFVDVAGNAKHPVAARRHAVRLAGHLRDRALTRPLLDLLDRERERAFSSADSLGVAAATLYALGKHGDPAAIPAILDAAEESSAFPELQGAAAAALGELCRAMPPAQRQRAVTILTALAASGQHQSATPARGALHRCRR